jgi:ribosome-binding protein aMBF1 (putative translation factor)
MAREHDTAEVALRHLPSSEIWKRMAKADLPKAEIVDWRGQIGTAIERARILSGLSLKEYADKIGRDVRQVGRWITGDERAQLDAIFAVRELRGPLVIALAELSQTVEVETTIRIRRSA